MKQLALAALVLGALGCRDAPSLEEGRAVQRDIRRAIITCKSLGRYGAFALLQEDLKSMPCEAAPFQQRGLCRVDVVGQGTVELDAAPAALVAAGRLTPGVPIAIRYRADCTRRAFDFKTFDQVLPRVRATPSETAWEDHLVRVTWTRTSREGIERCGVSVEAAPALLARIAAGPSGS